MGDDDEGMSLKPFEPPKPPISQAVCDIIFVGIYIPTLVEWENRHKIEPCAIAAKNKILSFIPSLLGDPSAFYLQ